MIKDRAFLVRMVKTPPSDASTQTVKSLHLTAPQVKQIAIYVGAAYTYVVALHTVRELVLITARAKIR